jgi:myosin heavy subunit
MYVHPSAFCHAQSHTYIYIHLPTPPPNTHPHPTHTQNTTQLLALMAKIHRTRPHFMRCLKPNDQNVPDALERARLTEQLRYGGVLEAVRG